MSDRARHAAAAAVIVAAALLVFGPALAKREVFMFRDHSDYFQPLRLFTAQHLRVWRLPLWNPYNGSGEPWLANPQTAVFYPPAWLFLILPFPTAYVAYLFVHSLILGGGAYRLFARRAAPLAAVGGAVALMISGPVISMLDVSNNFTTFAWLPLLIFCALEERHLAAAVVLAMSFLAGEPFLAAIAALIFAILARRAKTIAVVGSFAAGLSAIQLLPFLELVAKSDRVGFGHHDGLESSMAARDWLRMIVPQRLMRLPQQQFILVAYVSLFVVLLAVFGCFALIREQRRSALMGWLSLLIVAALFACGPRWLALIPIEMSRFPARLVPYVALSLVALAVAGWNRAAGKSAAVSVVLTIAIAADLWIAARPLLATAPFTRARVPYPQAIGRTSKILQDYGEHLLTAGARTSWIAGYTNLFELRFAATTAAPMTLRRYDDLLAGARPRLDLLRAISTGYILSAQPLGLEAVAQSQRIVVYRVPNPLPMAYVIAPGGAEMPPRALAIDASSARVRVDTASGGTVVVTQNDDSGWRVAVDGRDAPKKLAFGALRAVDVGPGKHEIVWIYRPFSLVAGAAITLLTIAAMMVVRSRALILSR